MKLMFFLAIVILGAVITSVNKNFLTLENILDLLKSYSFVGILSIGVLFVLISGGIDISFTATATVSMYVMAVIINAHGGNMFTAFLIAIIIGIGLGMINAVIIYFFNIQSIIASIATLNIYHGSADCFFWWEMDLLFANMVPGIRTSATFYIDQSGRDVNMDCRLLP